MSVLFSIRNYGILKTVKTSNLKANNDEKMAIKEKDLYFIFLAEKCKKTNTLKESCQKNAVLKKTKNNTFFTFLD